MDLYIASGPYHIFVVLCLKLLENKNREGMICIIDCFNQAPDLYKSIEQSNVFDETYLMPWDKYVELTPRLRHIKELPKYVDLKRRHMVYNGTPLFERIYDRIYVPGDILMARSLLLYQKKHNNAEIVLFDDGLGSRMADRKNITVSTRLKMMAFRCFGLRDTFDFADRRIFFSPEQATSRFPGCPVGNQKKPSRRTDEAGVDDESKEAVKRINKVFSFDEENNPFNDVDVLYLSNGFEVCAGIGEYAIKDKELSEKCAAMTSDFAIKRHPLSQMTFREGIKVFETKAPLEVCFMNTEMDNKLIISPVSAALFNPKFIFDQEPYVALVYKLIGFKDIAQKLFGGISERELEKRVDIALRNAYRDPKKVCIPETMEELKVFIDQFNRRERLAS